MQPVKTTSRRRGQGAKATQRLGENCLQKNMVIRCSDELYSAAGSIARAHDVSLSDYIRSLIIRDLHSRSG